MPPSSKPLLTIAIPTFNRAGYLRANLDQLRTELDGVPAGVVELIVSDNCSPDETPQVVSDAVAGGMSIRYLRNEKNLGWGPNFAQSYAEAAGKFVLLLGDDDLFVDGSLKPLLTRLASADYGVVVVGAYGYDDDFRAEYPGNYGDEFEFDESNAFLEKVGLRTTFTSACVINKSVIPRQSLDRYTNGDLATLPLVLRAAIAAQRNLLITRFVIAGKRQNSFNYDYAKAFVKELWSTYDDHAGPGLKPQTIRAIERTMLRTYYPFYAFDFRLARRNGLDSMKQHFGERYRTWPTYWFWVAPTLYLPRSLAIVWGAGTTAVGRVMGGELRRGLTFAAAKLRKRLTRRAASGGPSSQPS
ncbi:MAG: hypothetical protein CTY20_03025 [Hyphomicrobium sp.]|nr:MAG: hypothetical protein CTY20_03025 [Hyphomicrobium sp.]